MSSSLVDIALKGPLMENCVCVCVWGSYTKQPGVADVSEDLLPVYQLPETTKFHKETSSLMSYDFLKICLQEAGEMAMVKVLMVQACRVEFGYLVL